MLDLWRREVLLGLPLGFRALPCLRFPLAPCPLGGRPALFPCCAELPLAPALFLLLFVGLGIAV